VIAGTATATSKAISSSMDNAAQRKQQEQMAAAENQAQMTPEQIQAQLAALQAQQIQAQQAQSQAPAANTDLIAQLQQLAQLKESGVLTDEEFQAAKAKLIGS
jgi:hypothetical protein